MSINIQTNRLARNVVVMPTKALDRDQANQQLEEARPMIEDLGIEITRSLASAGAVAARATEDQQAALKKAGFQVISDQKIRLLPKGWLKSPKALEALATFDFFDPFAPFRRPAPRPVEQPRSGEGASDYIGELPTSGKGIGIAIIDSGVEAHPDFGERFLGNVSPIQANRPYKVGKDPVGHGTHVAGDAAGDGRLSGGRFRGPAHDANIIGIQVLDESEYQTDMSQALEEFTSGIDWMVNNREKYNIKVANLSLSMPLLAEGGGFYGPELLYDPIGAAINRAVQAGITVVAAAGNSGPDQGSIDGTPAINDNVITVGALDTNGTPQDRRDDSVAEFSSRGPTPDGRLKPDILAPGVKIVAPNAPGSEIDSQNSLFAKVREAVPHMNGRQLAGVAYKMVQAGVLPEDVLYMDVRDLQDLFAYGLDVQPTEGQWKDGAAYIGMDGTSMASPIVTGVVAAMLEANPDLTPAQVKQILVGTADPVGGESRVAQGAGAINARKAVEVALRSRGA